MRNRLALAALWAAGCAGSASPNPDAAVDLAVPPPFCTDGQDGGPPANFTSVQQILSTNCAVPGCHDGSPFGAPVMQDLREGHAYASLVGVPAVEMCDGGVPMTRVVPGDAGASWMYHKLVDTPPCSGEQMPRSEVGSQPLPACEIAIIRGWIESGASP